MLIISSTWRLAFYKHSKADELQISIAEVAGPAALVAKLQLNDKVSGCAPQLIVKVSTWLVSCSHLSQVASLAHINVSA